MRPSIGIGVLVCASAAVLAGLVAASGCTVLTNDGLPDDAGKYDAESDGSAPICAACLAQLCTGQFATCFDDPACVAMSKCAARGELCSCPGTDAGATTDASTDPREILGALIACAGYNGNPGPAPGGSASGACTQQCSDTNLPKGSACDVADASADDASDDVDAGDASADGAGDAAVEDASIADADAGPDANDTPATLADYVARCSKCVSNECGDAKKACAIGSECAAYLECTFAAPDAAAADECGRQHASGKTAAAELATCTRVGCSDACGF